MKEHAILRGIVGNVPLAFTLLKVQKNNNEITDFVIKEANEEFIGYFPDPLQENVIGHRIKALLKFFDMEKYKLFEAIRQSVNDGENHIEDIYFKNIDKYLELKINRIDEHHVVIFIIDITEKMEVEKLKDNFEEQHAVLRTALDATPDMVAIKDLKGTYLMVNEAVNEHFSNRFGNIEGMSIKDVYPDYEIPKIEQLDQEAIQSGKTMRKKVAVYTDVNKYVVSDITRSPIYNHENELIGLISVGRDISEEERTKEELQMKNKELKRLTDKFKELSYKDDLTKLANRRRFYQDIKSLDTTRKYTLILIDLNNFKMVNDYFGHNYGDKALTDYAHYLEEIVAQYNGNTYRIGGDEFSILVTKESKFSMEDYISKINNFLSNYHKELSLAYGETTIDGKAKKDSIYLDITLKSADKLLYDFKNKLSSNK